jgi:RNA polymerase sigma-70 factor (ECF subfamily)
MIGVAIGTVKSRTNRARARLCELLGLRAGEDPIADANDAATNGLTAAGVEAA